MKLKVAKIRGIESTGMLCSGSELNQSLDKDGIIELNKMENNIGKKYFKSSGEEMIDIAITPNRPDCLGCKRYRKRFVCFRFRAIEKTAFNKNKSKI